MFLCLKQDLLHLEQGTGIVHCAPSHGPDDFNLCLKHNIPSKYTVDNAGYIQMKFLFYKTHVFKADPIVIDKLKEKKLLKMISFSIATLIHGDQKLP